MCYFSVDSTLTPVEEDSSRPPFFINNEPYYAIGDQPPPTYTEAVQTPGATLRPRRSIIPSSAFVVQQQRHSSFQASSSSVTSVQGQADIGASALQVVGLQVHTPAGSADPFSSSRVVSTSSKNSKLKTVEPPTYAQSQAAVQGVRNPAYIAERGSQNDICVNTSHDGSIFESSV